MYQILTKRVLAPGIFLMDVLAPRVVRSAKPGQFLIVRVNERAERIPLTICDYDLERESVTIVFQVVGNSTKLMESLEVGDSFVDFAGPLGEATELLHLDSESLASKNILFIAGGVGTAPVYPQVKWLANAGCPADVIIGARSADYLIMTEEMKQVSKTLYLATDDGSEGFHGNVTALLKHLVVEQNQKYDLVVTIGPMIMMKFVSALTRELGIPTIASLNTLMVDGTGMCGGCRVTVGGKSKFTCVDGPEFDAHQVDFEEAMRRQTMYKKLEQGEPRGKDHACKLDKLVEGRNS